MTVYCEQRNTNNIAFNCFFSADIVKESFQCLVLIPGFACPCRLLLVFVNTRTRVVPMSVKEAIMRLDK